VWDTPENPAKPDEPIDMSFDGRFVWSKGISYKVGPDRCPRRIGLYYRRFAGVQIRIGRAPNAKVGVRRRCDINLPNYCGHLSISFSVRRSRCGHNANKNRRRARKETE